MSGASWELSLARFPALRERLKPYASNRAGLDGLRQARDPKQLSQRWAVGLDLKPYSALAMAGVGNGEHIDALLERLPEGSTVFCAEADCAVFKAYLESERGRRHSSDPRIYLGAGELDATFFASMESFPVLDASDAQPLIFAPLYQKNPTYYASFFREFARSLDYWRKLQGTNALYSGHWQSNTIRNLGSLGAAPDIGRLGGFFKGCDMVIASAGPSLDEALPHLRRVADRVVIVAVNSSFRALRNVGIEPHFVLAADPYEWTDRGFEGVDLGRSILLCPFIVFPKVAARFQGRVATWSAGNLLASYLRIRCGQGLGTFVREQGTVSACVFDVAKLFGCRSLSFVGQDFAVKPDGQSHAKDSFYTDLNWNRTRVENCRWLPGNATPEVPVEEKLYVYLKTFEELAPHYSRSLRLANYSPLGARIEGIPYRSLNGFEEAFRKASAGGISIGWNKARLLCAESEPMDGFREELGRMGDFLGDCLGRFLKQAIRLQMAEGGFDESLVEESERERDSLLSLLASEAGIYSILQDGQLKKELLAWRKEGRAIKEMDIPELEKRGLSLEAYLWAYGEALYQLAREIERAMGSEFLGLARK